MKLITTKLGVNMPKAVKENAMAPAAPKVRATKKKVPDVKSSVSVELVISIRTDRLLDQTITPLRKEDPPLGSGAPQPTTQNVKATNLNVPFGFRAGPPKIPASRLPVLPTASRAQLPAHTPAQTHAPALSHIADSAPPPPSKPQQRIHHESHIESRKPKEVSFRSVIDEGSHSPLLPSKARISDRFAPSSKAPSIDRAHSEVIPDSEEERNRFRGNPVRSQGDRNSGENDGTKDSSHSDSEEDEDHDLGDDQDDAAVNSSMDEDDEDQDDPAMNNSEDLANEYDADLIAEQSQDPGAGKEDNENGALTHNPLSNTDAVIERMDVDESTSDEEYRIEQEHRIAQGIHKRSARRTHFFLQLHLTINLVCL